MKNKGFILAEYLLSLLIIVSLLPIITSAFRIIANAELYDNEIQDFISINQLRERLIIAEDFHYKLNDVCFFYKDKENCLRYANDKLYIYPGYLLYLDDIDSLYFELDSEVLIINYAKNKKLYSFAIAKV